MADARWPVIQNAVTVPYFALEGGASTCDVVGLAARHEHCDRAHVQQLWSRLHVKREVGECSGGSDGDAAAAHVEVGSFEQLGKEAVARAKFVSDGSCERGAF